MIFKLPVMKQIVNTNKLLTSIDGNSNDALLYYYCKYRKLSYLRSFQRKKNTAAVCKLFII